MKFVNRFFLFCLLAVVAFGVPALSILGYVNYTTRTNTERAKAKAENLTLAQPDCGGSIIVEFSKRIDFSGSIQKGSRTFIIPREKVVFISPSQGERIYYLNKKCTLKEIRNVIGIKFNDGDFSVSLPDTNSTPDYYGWHIRQNKENSASSGTFSDGVKYIKNSREAYYVLPNKDPQTIKGSIVVHCGGKQPKREFCQVISRVKDFHFRYEVSTSVNPDKYIKIDDMKRKALLDLFLSREMPLKFSQ